MDDPRGKPAHPADYSGVSASPPRPEHASYEIDLQQAFAVDLDLTHGDCDPPKNWPKGKWVADFLLSATHPRFRFERDADGRIAVIVEEKTAERYWVLARHPRATVGDLYFAINGGAQSYHDGYEALHFADTLGRVVTASPADGAHRATLTVVMGTLEQRLETIAANR